MKKRGSGKKGKKKQGVGVVLSCEFFEKTKGYEYY
jgi:hypothetical protein